MNAIGREYGFNYGQNLEQNYGKRWPDSHRQDSEQTDSRIREMKRMIANADTEKQKNPYQATVKNSVLDSLKKQSETLRTQRQSTKDSTLAQKKLNYQSKSVSAKILRSKTSTAAREAVRSAKQEVVKLKRAKASGQYDAEEVEAALQHAKAMERVAKKKVKHLEEEEAAKRVGHGGGLCVDNYGTDEKVEEPEKDDAFSAEETDEALEAEESAEELAAKLSEEFTEEMSDSLAEMASEVIDSLSEVVYSGGGETDPEDIKEMELKHRNKENKEMVKADADYLKQLFDRYERIRSGYSQSVPTGFSGGPLPGFSQGGDSVGATVLNLTV